MKRITSHVLIIGALTISGGTLYSCTNKEEREKLRQEVKLLERQLHERDSSFNEIMDVMTQVENQIDEIKDRENIIAGKSVSGDFTDADDNNVIKDMMAINDLINRTNTQVNDLSEKLNNANIEIGAFKSRINRLSQDLDERKNAISELREALQLKDIRISELDSEVLSLVSQVDLQSQTIDEQKKKLEKNEEKLHKAYFAVDSEKRLRDKGLVSREGGFLGIGRITELEEDVAQDKFREIDIRDTHRFYVNSDKVDIITEHPSGSYELVKENSMIKYIEVTDPEQFWKISRYLVVSVKG